MKCRLTLVMALGLAAAASAAPSGEKYSFTFRLGGCTDTVLYLAQHYRDGYQWIDSARVVDGWCEFRGRHDFSRGIYALVHQDRKKLATDFCIDDSRQFSINGDAGLSPESITVKGSRVNEQMYAYIATINAAKKEMNDIRERKKATATQAQAEVDEKALMERMERYEADIKANASGNIFFELQQMCEAPEPPEEEADKATWYRLHYWDNLLPTHFGQDNGMRQTLLHSPQFFGKMNYYFFGILYYAYSELVAQGIDNFVAVAEGDTMLMRYVFDFIEPRYFRSTTNIGWDAVWCHLVEQYYSQGRCPWVSEGTRINMQKKYERISQSIIGARGKELCMLDTTQIESPEHWVCSHHLPQKYVVLWFWDPDCHHCQEQSAALKVLYDSLLTAPYRPLEVYAVGYENDLAKWKRYIREHDFRWINVGGPNVNIDYQEAYNVHGAPTMIILNERREIIMNKPIPAKELLPFIADYEKKQSAQR
ncbi:MAG: DUF5106 domain-containing protein [Bacteroidales bacterium]|nr:DUF5106 domain-containing protein [Bacteroidales bacterium]